jgi:mRNA-degrading endonuclease RelE of RelBE toxin-antitoxin system
MNYAVFLHPSVVKYLDHLSENERKRCYMSLKMLSNDPYRPRGGCDSKIER